MISNRQKLFLMLLVSALVLLCCACHASRSDDDPEAAAEILEEALAPREVRLVLPEVREERPTLQLVGEIRAFDTVAVSSEVAGKVDRVLVEVGDRVKRGTALFEVDRTTFEIYLHQGQAELAAARADLDLASKALERKRDLRSDETVPQAVLDEAQAMHDLAKARLAAAEAGLRLAERNYERSIIRAPSSGVVTERQVAAGGWAEVGAGLLTLAVGDTVKVAARVPEAWTARLAGLKSFDFSAGVGGPTLTARIYSVQPVVREASRSFEIVGTVDNDGSLRPGMFATVILTAPGVERSLWLVAAAIATSDLPQVMLAVDGEVAYRKVQIGRRNNGMVEVVSGLEEDQPVIADVSGLHRGLPITIVDAAAVKEL